jgi:hypothetical protein
MNLEQYLYPALFGLGELIVLLILLILIFKNKKVQATLSKLFTFIGKANSEDNSHPSAARLNQFYASTILVLCVAFGFVYVVVTPTLSGSIFSYLTVIIGYLLTLAGFKVWQKTKEEPLSGFGNLQPTETKTVNTTSSTVTTGAPKAEEEAKP